MISIKRICPKDRVNYLKFKILSDLKNIGIKCDFDLVIRPYSKTMYGYYSPKHRRVVIYLYRDLDCKNEYNYMDLVKTSLHEVVHHLQWKDPSFIRLKGIMHNTNFYIMYNYYLKKLDVLLRERVMSFAEYKQYWRAN